MLLLLLACAADCQPASQTTLEPGGSEEARSTLATAIADFVSWSGRDVCVTTITVDQEWDERSDTIEVADDPKVVREQAFYDLCWLADIDAAFALDHPMAFTGRAVNETSQARAAREDFARSCAQAQSRAPWIRAAMEQCGERLPERDQALLEFFDTPSAGYPDASWESTLLGSLALAGYSGAAIVGDLLVVNAGDVEFNRLHLFQLPSLEPQGTFEFPAGRRWLFPGLTTALWIAETGQVFEVTESGLVEGVPIEIERFQSAVQDGSSWWWTDNEHRLFRYDLEQGSTLVETDVFQAASGDPLWLRTHDGVTASGSYQEALIRSSQHRGRVVFLGGTAYTSLDAGPHRLLLRQDEDQHRLVDTWCEGALEWTQPQRTLYASSRWIVEIHHRAYWDLTGTPPAVYLRSP